MQDIVVKCTGNEKKNIDELAALQGSLKVLTQENYEKLKGRILDFGFLEPITIWRDRNEILNGHQRVTALRNMREEGYSIPLIPVNSISVKDRAEAKRIILSLTSQYGLMSESSLAEFIKEAEIDLEELMLDYEFAGIDGDILEGVIRSLEIDTSYVEKFDDEAKRFEEEFGKSERKLHLLLYVEFDKKEDYEYVQSVLCSSKTSRKINVDKLLTVISGCEDEV